MSGADHARPTAPSPDPLLRSRRFLPLFLVQALGAFNDNVFKNAFVALLTFRLIDELDLEMGLVALTTLAAAVFILPFALFAPIAGEIADRIDKARMMRAVKAVEIALMVAAAVAYHAQSVWMLYTLLFLMGAQSAFFSPIKYGVLPSYLRDDELVAGNGLMQAATFLAILFGTIAGFQLILTPGGVTIVSAAVVSLAVVGYAASLYAPPAPPSAAAQEDPIAGVRLAPRTAGDRQAALGFGAASVASAGLVAAAFASDPGAAVVAALAAAAFIGGLYALWPSMAGAAGSARREPVVWRSVLAIGWFWFVAASFMALLPALAKETLSSDENVVTVLLATFSIGVAIGASLVSKLQAGRITVGVAPIGALGIAVASMDLLIAAGGGLAPPAQGPALHDVSSFLGTSVGWRVLADFLLLAVCAGLYVTPLNAIYQHNAPPDARGRVVAASNMIDSALMAFSAVVILGFQAAGMTPPQILALLGVSGLATALIVGRWAPETRFGRAVLSFWPRRGDAG